MSSLTQATFLAELKVRSGVIASFDDSDIVTLLGVALRAYSRKLPEVRVSADNAVVSGQELYDYPTNALSIIKIRDSESRREILFATENQGNGDQFRLGNLLTRSYDALLTEEFDFYNDPLSQQSGKASGYSSFDIEFIQLHTMSSVKDTGIEALFHYMEYLAYTKKAAEASAVADEDIGEVPESITDADSSGSSTTIKFTTRSALAKKYEGQANVALGRFNDETDIAYGTRG